MRNIDGKDVFTELAEVLDPKHTALLVIDVQGNWDMWHHDNPAIVARIASVLKTARDAGVMVLYFRNVLFPRHTNVSPPYLRLLLQGGYKPGEDPIPCFEGGPETDIVDRIKPQSGEKIIDKARASAFAGTNLDMILRSNGIESLALVGGSTDWCVEATVWDATGRDYYTVMLSDCVHGPRPKGHEAALKQMDMIADVAASEEVIMIWRSAGSVAIDPIA